MTDRLLDSRTAATELDIPETMIWTWKSRGARIDGVLRRLTPAGLVPGRGRGGRVPLYRPDDLTPFVEAYRSRQTRRAEAQKSRGSTSSCVDGAR